MSDLMTNLFHEFTQLFTLTGLIALVNIIFIDVVMSGDNALLIGMATKNLEARERKRAIFLGVVFATVLRVIFALLAVYLLSILGVKLAGGLILLYVVYKLYREIRAELTPHIAVQASINSLRAVIMSIVLADVSMSLDNVLAVAGASHGNVVALGIGLVVSVLLMAIASNFMAVLLQKYPKIQWIGLLILLYVALHMIYTGSVEVYDFTLV